VAGKIKEDGDKKRDEKERKIDRVKGVVHHIFR